MKGRTPPSGQGVQAAEHRGLGKKACRRGEEAIESLQTGWGLDSFLRGIRVRV